MPPPETLGHYAADPDVLRVVDAIRELTSELQTLRLSTFAGIGAELNTLNETLAANVQQLQQLYRQRDFELHQRYHEQAFLDFDNPPRRSPHADSEPDSSRS